MLTHSNVIPTRRWALPLAVLLLVGCGGGGGGGGGGANPPPEEPPAPPPSSTLWVSGAAQTGLFGDADSGIGGALFAVDPARPQSPVNANPGVVDSTSRRIVGGTVDATLSSRADASPRTVLFDAPAGGSTGSSFSLYKFDLAVASAATPAAVRVSSETAMCNVAGERFRVIGQTLSGSEAVITYSTPDALGSCGAGGLPRLVTSGMSSSSAPVSLPEAATERATPIGAIHGASGQIAAFLAWRDGAFVRTDARLGNAAVIPGADIAGTVSAASMPTGPGIVTRFGIFIVSDEGLRRYDKSTGRISDVLVAGDVGSGAVINDFHDGQALYITATTSGGVLDLYRVADTLAPTAEKLNVEGPLNPYGFRVSLGYVLYALDGTTDYVAWRKADGQRSAVLADKNVLVVSSLHDRVFHESLDGSGARVLASSHIDGSDELQLGDVQLVSRSIAAQTPPFARNVRDNGAYSHVLLIAPAAGAVGLAGGTARWAGFEGAAQDIEAGSFPATPTLGTAVEAPGIVGAAAVFSVAGSAGGAASYFGVRRAAGSLVRVDR